MKNTLFAVRNPGRLVCIWRLTGDSKTPLVCVWLEADPRAASPMSSLDKEPAGLRLCA
jgi:hypothetical protein